MRNRLRSAWPMVSVGAVFGLLLSIALAQSAAQAQSTTPTPVLTQHNDNGRSGSYLTETTLSPQTVSESTFGKLWQLPVDGRIYSQPLYVPNVSIGGGTHNVVYIATANDSVYAYDADSAGLLYWRTSLGTPVPSSDYNNGTDVYKVVYPTIGILGTPVIDQQANTLYCVANITTNGTHQFILHALSLSTGLDVVGNGVQISATVPGTGTGSVGGQMSFTPFLQLQRPALLENNGVLFIEFGAHQENGNAHGWIFAYSPSTLAQLAVLITTPTGIGLGSFWNSGQGPAADSDGNIYSSTGNGAINAFRGGQNYSMSVLRIVFNGSSLSIADYFTPWDYVGLDNTDKDLGVSGPLLIPNSNLVLQGGKDGHFYLMQRSNLGHFDKTGDDQIEQDFQACARHIHGSPIYWQSGNGQYVYVWSEIDHLKQYQLVNGLFNTTPFAESPMADPIGMPGGMLSLSANGSTPGSGIVWALDPYNQNGQLAIVTGVLRAFNADNVSDELWDSEINPTRDKTGAFAKFVAPTIANGRVYAATDSNRVSVYGLLPTN
jgi:hypothetical protein